MHIWDLRSSKPLWLLKGHTARVLRVAENVVAINQGGRNYAYLLFPEAHGLAELKDAEISDRTPSLKVVRDTMQQVLATEPGQEVEQPVDLAVLTAMKLAVPVKKATMPDFVRFYDISIMNPKVLVGMFMGVMLTFVFCALTMKAVGRAAKGMVEEVRRQFREKPGIMAGTDIPDYAEPVRISTQAAQREMILPSVLGLIMPVATGLVLGVAGILGLLVGTLTTGFCVAIFMANAGGAWDNAKKHIERGNYGGKKTDAHRAAVVRMDARRKYQSVSAGKSLTSLTVGSMAAASPTIATNPRAGNTTAWKTLPPRRSSSAAKIVSAMTAVTAMAR